MSDQTDTPDTPPEVLARQSRSTPLTQTTAELIGAKAFQRDDGKMSDEAKRKHLRTAAAQDARKRAEVFAGPTPLKGISEDVVAAIRSATFDDAPKQDPTLGFRTQAYVNWMWANHPHEAVILYAYRDIWPTLLPKHWVPSLAAKVVALALYNKPARNGAALPPIDTTAAPRVYTQAEVDAMMAAARQPAPAVKRTRAKRITVRKPQTETASIPAT
jgi:hypothetical protein